MSLERQSLNVTRSALDLLLNVYFHQDWDIDASSADEIVELFLSSERTTVIRAARDEAARLLTKANTDDALENALAGRRLGYDPSFDGVTDRAWLEGLVGRLTTALERPT
jgi:hypothetical protein